MIIWCDCKPGECTNRYGDCISIDEECATLYYSGIPDWVRLPGELGGQQRRVNGSYHMSCPKCKAPDVLVLVLEDGISVAECSGVCGFVWFRKENSK